jgi:serine/threonine protein kinase
MENTLIDKDGYAVLGDFGVCKELKYRPSSCCGTKDFLPPEVMVRNK